MQKLITAFKEGNIQFIQDEFTRVINEQLTPFIQESFISESAKEEDVVGHKMIQIAGRRYDFNKQFVHGKDTSTIQETVEIMMTGIIKMLIASAEHTYRGILSGNDVNLDIDFNQFVYMFNAQSLAKTIPNNSKLNILVDWSKYNEIKNLYEDAEYHRIYSVISDMLKAETYNEFPLIIYSPAIVYFKDIREDLKVIITEDEMYYNICVEQIYDFAYTNDLNKNTLYIFKMEMEDVV